MIAKEEESLQVETNLNDSKELGRFNGKNHQFK